MSEFLKNNLQNKTDLEWFDAICGILKRDKHPTTQQLESLVGNENPDIEKGSRGSKFLIPFDKRFTWACINPDLANDEADMPIEYLSFGGADFSLKMTDVLVRFPQYKTQPNIYDGGTQIFFYPVPGAYAFSALSFPVDKDPADVTSLVFHSITFHFGDQLLLARDGYHLRNSKNHD